MIKEMKYCDHFNGVQQEFWMDSKDEVSNLPTENIALFSYAIAAKDGTVYYFNGKTWEPIGG